MANVFTSLQKILDLELQRGCQNDAVVGGLDRYAQRWQSQAVNAVSGRERTRRVEQIADALMGYPLLPEGARPSTIRNIQESLQSLSQDRSKEKRKVARKSDPGRVSPPRSQTPSFTLSPLAAPLTSLSGIGPKLSGTLSRLDYTKSEICCGICLIAIRITAICNRFLISKSGKR